MTEANARADTPLLQRPLKVFISYARRDHKFVDWLDNNLRSHGLETLVDRKSIEKFADWWERIEQLIVQSDAVVCVLSKAMARSAVARREVDFAVSCNKRLAPLVIEDVADRNTPDALKRLNYVFARKRDNRDAAFGDLLNGLQADIDWVREHTRLSELTHLWALKAKSSDLLLRGAELEAAEAWIATPRTSMPLASDLQRVFVSVSRTEWNAGQSTQIDRLNQIRARALVLAGERVFPSDPQLALILGAHAVNTTWRHNRTALEDALTLLRRALMATLPGVGDLPARASQVAWSHDGARLLVGLGDGSACILDVQTGKALQVFEAHAGERHEQIIEDVAWSADDALVATCGRDGFATVWNAATGEGVARIDCRGSDKFGIDAQTVDWDADGRLLVGGLAMSRIWHRSQALRTGPRGRARWRPHHRTLAVANVEANIRFLDDAFNVIAEVNSAHERYVYSLAWSPDGSRLATCSVDEDLKIWTATGELVAAITGAEAGSLTWNAQGTLLACGAEHLVLRDAQTLAILHEVSSPETLLGSATGHGLGYSSGVAWSPDGQVLAVGTSGKVFLLPIALLQTADAGDLIGFAKRHITRALSSSEVQLYFDGAAPEFA